MTANGTESYPGPLLFADSVQACLNPKLSDRSKVVWLLMQPMLGAGSGFLLENGEPMSVAALATKIWREPKQVSTDIDNLVKFDLLRRDEEGAVFDPVMANNLAGYDRRNQEKQGGGQIETCLNRHSSLSKDANPKSPQYSTVPSKSGTSHLLRQGTTTGGAAPLQTNQASRPGGQGRRLSFGLTEADIVAAQAEFPQHDVEKLLPRFIKVNNEKDCGVKASKNPLKWLKGFLKTQRIGKSSLCQNSDTVTRRDTSKGPKLKCKVKPDEDLTWKIGKEEFADDEHIETIRNMPLQSRASADQWLCDAIGFDWNTDAAFSEFGDGDLFYCNADGTVEGVTSAERRSAEQRESEKIQKSLENSTAPQTVTNVTEPAKSKVPDEIAHEEFMARVAAEKAAAADAKPGEIQPGREPELTEPSHGDVREDGKIYSDRYGKWFPKDRFDNLERIRKTLSASPEFREPCALQIHGALQSV